MSGTTRSIAVVHADFLTPVLPKISRETKREALIEVHWLISGNTTSMELNLGVGRQRHLVLTMTTEDFMLHTGYYDLCKSFPMKSSRANKYIYHMYVYYCDAILTTAVNNISEKELM